MRYSAVIFVLTVASAIPSWSKHADVEIYKRTLIKSGGPSHSKSPNKPRGGSPERKKSSQSLQSIDRTKLLDSSDQQISRSRSSSTKSLYSLIRPEASSSDGRPGHSSLPSLERENPVTPQGLPRGQSPERSRSGGPQQGNRQATSTPERGHLLSGIARAHNLNRQAPTGTRQQATDTAYVGNRPPEQTMCRDGNCAPRVANAANAALTWAANNPTTAAFAGCAAGGACLTGAGIGMVAAGTAATQAAGLLTVGIGGGLSVGTTAAAAGSYYSGLDNMLIRPWANRQQQRQ